MTPVLLTVTHPPLPTEKWHYMSFCYILEHNYMYCYTRDRLDNDLRHSSIYMYLAREELHDSHNKVSILY